MIGVSLSVFDICTSHMMSTTDWEVSVFKAEITRGVIIERPGDFSAQGETHIKVTRDETYRGMNAMASRDII